MTPHPLVSTDKPSPEPGEYNRYPWRFVRGQYVYVNGYPADETVKVTGGALYMGWPHLTVLDQAGKTWRIPQIHCSSRPLYVRN